MYGDFFDKPKPTASLPRRGHKGEDMKNVIKGKERNVHFELDSDDNAMSEDEDDAGESREVMGRLKGDLFDDDEEDEEEPDQSKVL